MVLTEVFSKNISLKNLGFARHIYEAADASLQLQKFYKEISSPLLANVTFKYVSNVSEVTKTYFPILFNGSEIVVSGQIGPWSMAHIREFYIEAKYKNIKPEEPDVTSRRQKPGKGTKREERERKTREAQENTLNWAFSTTTRKDLGGFIPHARPRS
ncbi:hypothetical protein JTB14_017264 [Gonioctena quinquepunctata]|nr:hypothetical protein JTB14_017264 [Gonioctena quinquepunctata]